MVSAAVLRHSSLDHIPDPVHLEQAGWGALGVRSDFHIVFPALARYLASAQRSIPADLQMGILAIGHRRDRAGLGWREPSRRNRRHRRPDRDTLLLCSHADPAAADRQARTAATVAD